MTSFAFMPLNQGTNALGIAIATADELGILYFSILIHTDADVLGAGTMSLISYLRQLILIFVVELIIMFLLYFKAFALTGRMGK